MPFTSLCAQELFGTRKYDAATHEYGDYVWRTWSQVAEDVAALCAAYATLGIGQNDPVAIFANNSEHWAITDLAAQRRGAVLVPLYHTYGITALAFILRQVQVRVVVCAHESFATLLDCIKSCRHSDKHPSSSSSSTTTTTTTNEQDEQQQQEQQQQQQQEEDKCIVSSIVLLPPVAGPHEDEEVAEGLLARAEKYGVRVVRWAEALAAGRAAPVAPSPTGSAALDAIVYTSGTSGLPKGVMIAHRALVATADNICAHYDLGVPASANVHLSYLPLAHVYERSFLHVMLRVGGAVGFFSGAAARLIADMRALRPTFIIGVPRVWKRVHDKVMETVAAAPFYKRWLFRYAYAAKAAADAGGGAPWVDWDALVFRAVRAQLGGRARWLGSASAPLPAELAQWLARVLGAHLVLMYGLTETVGGVTASQYHHPTQRLRADALSSGHVCRHTAVRLVDAPELGYTVAHRPPAGEVLVRGANVAAGYYRSPQLTAAAWDADGWFHTGDIGVANADGSLTIVDRRKNMFKLAQGEYVPAEFLETVFSHSPLVAQIMVHGASTETFVVALVVPSFEALAASPALSARARALAAAAGPDGRQASPPFAAAAAELCALPEVAALLLDTLGALAADARLPHFQIPKRVLAVPGPWTVDDDLVTPTMKLRRPRIVARYSDILTAAIRETAQQLEHKASSSSSSSG